MTCRTTSPSNTTQAVTATRVGTYNTERGTQQPSDTAGSPVQRRFRDISRHRSLLDDLLDFVKKVLPVLYGVYPPYDPRNGLDLLQPPRCAFLVVDVASTKCSETVRAVDQLVEDLHVTPQKWAGTATDGRKSNPF